MINDVGLIFIIADNENQSLDCPMTILQYTTNERLILHNPSLQAFAHSIACARDPISIRNTRDGQKMLGMAS